MNGISCSEKWLDQQPDHEPTVEDLVAEEIRIEQIMAEQRQCLPDWWLDDWPAERGRVKRNI